jgi:hypothetical protein
MSDIQITLWNSLLDTNGNRKDLTWGQLSRFLDSPEEFSGKNHGGWSATSFESDRRGLEHVITANALVLDFDGTTIRDVLTALFTGNTFLCHSSKRNSETSPRYRAVLQLSRPVNREDYYRIWRAYTAPFRKRVDIACKDPSRFWYRPCKTAETKWETWGETSTPLDVDALIAKDTATEAKLAAAREVARAEMAKVIQLRPEGNRVSAAERASRYVAKMDGAIAGSHGHDATWAAACVLVRGFDLDRGTALAILVNEYNQRCVPPWEIRDLERKIDQAATKANKLDRGYLLGDSSGWTSERRAEMPPTPPPPDDGYVPEPPPGWDDPDGVAVDEPGCQAEPVDEPGAATSAPPNPEPPPEVILAPTAAERYGAISIQELCLEVLTDVNRTAKMGCPTGIGEIDLAMGGIREEMIAVLGMQTSVGKTTLSMMCADETCKTGRGPLVLTFEDAPLLYGRKLVARRGKLNATNIRDRDTTLRERHEIMRIAGAAETKPFLVDCRGKTAEYAANAIRELVRENGHELVIVDYLQRIGTEQRLQDRRNEVTYAVATISDAIKLSGAGGLLLSQLKRIEGRRPTMDDLKESGDIECFAEHVILGWKEVSGKGDIRRFVDLPKNKDGPVITEAIELKWHAVSASFEVVEATEELDRRANDNAIADIDDSLGAEHWQD